MSHAHMVPLTGSHRSPVQGARSLGPAAPDAVVDVTVQLALRDPKGLAAMIETPGYTPYTFDQFVQAHAPSRRDCRCRAIISRKQQPDRHFCLS